MTRLAIVIAIALFAAACARMPATAEQPVAASGTSEDDKGRRPHWQRDPARGEYPYSPRGWW
jgi:hypothetical protein